MPSYYIWVKAEADNRTDAALMFNALEDAASKYGSLLDSGVRDENGNDVKDLEVGESLDA